MEVTLCSYCSHCLHPSRGSTKTWLCHALVIQCPAHNEYHLSSQLRCPIASNSAIALRPTKQGMPEWMASLGHIQKGIRHACLDALCGMSSCFHCLPTGHKKEKPLTCMFTNQYVIKYIWEGTKYFTNNGLKLRTIREKKKHLKSVQENHCLVKYIWEVTKKFMNGLKLKTLKSTLKSVQERHRTINDQSSSIWHCCQNCMITLRFEFDLRFMRK